MKWWQWLLLALPLWLILGLLSCQLYWQNQVIGDLKKESQEMKKELHDLRDEIKTTRSAFQGLTNP